MFGTGAGQAFGHAGAPMIAYRPRDRNIHAIDEAVELACTVTGAKTLARLVAAFYAGEVRPR